jgi:hypothetical protein
MVTIERDPSASYGRWRLSIGRRASRPKLAPWLEVWFATRAEADVDAGYFRRAIVDGLLEAAALGIGVSKKHSVTGRGKRAAGRRAGSIAR